MNEYDLVGPQFLQFYMMLLSGSAIAALVLRAVLKHESGDHSELDMNAYDAAYLSGGDKRVIDAAVANLVHSNVFTARALPPSITATGTLSNTAHPVEQTVMQVVKSHAVTNVHDIYRYALPVSQYIRPKLVKAGLIVSDARTALVRTICSMLTLAPVIFWGVPKVLIGMSRHKPVLFLILLCGASLCMAWIFFRQKCLRTTRGDDALKYLRIEHQSLEYSLSHRSPTTGAELALALGLFGTGLLVASPAFADLSPLMRRSYGTAGSGCGSGGGCAGGGCGGGGCGGGCGGCGG